MASRVDGASRAVAARGLIRLGVHEQTFVCQGEGAVELSGPEEERTRAGSGRTMNIERTILDFRGSAARVIQGPRHRGDKVRSSGQTPRRERVGPPMSQIAVVDADGHVTEPMSLWTDYVEPAYRERAPRPVLDERGRPCMLLDGRLVMRHAMLLTLGPDYDVAAAKFQAGGWDPQARLRDMDSEGIDLAVLFPSVAFYLPETSDPALMAALCRAYNDWLADYCRAAPSRLVGVAMLPLADVDASIRELERATEKLGFRGAFVRPNPYAGRPIHHPAYARSWERAAALRVPTPVPASV